MWENCWICYSLSGVIEMQIFHTDLVWIWPTDEICGYADFGTFQTSKTLEYKFKWNKLSGNRHRFMNIIQKMSISEDVNRHLIWSSYTPDRLPTLSQPGGYFAWFQLNDFELRKGKKLGVTISFNNHRLFVGNIPKNRDRDELLEEFAKHARE